MVDCEALFVGTGYWDMQNNSISSSLHVHRIAIAFRLRKKRVFEYTILYAIRYTCTFYMNVNILHTSHMVMKMWGKLNVEHVAVAPLEPSLLPPSAYKSMVIVFGFTQLKCEWREPMTEPNTLLEINHSNEYI